MNDCDSLVLPTGSAADAAAPRPDHVGTGRTVPPDALQPMAPAGTGRVALGERVARIDGPAKVSGQARYSAEYPVDDLAWGVVVGSSIARGRIRAMHIDAALAVPGVLDVLTHERRPQTRSMDIFFKDMDAPWGSPFKPLHGTGIFYSGQPVALVIADTFEAARHAATLVRLEYDAKPHSTSLMSERHRAHKPSRLKAGFKPPPKPTGHPERAFAEAPIKIDAEFHSGIEHHNPMEMHASTVIYGEHGHLTIFDKSQGSQNCRWLVSQVFGLPKERVTVHNAFVGGAFGSGLRPQYNLILAVMGALQLRRSVRVVLTRQQMFSFGHRPESWQRIRLAASADGQLQSVMHEAIGETSRLEDYCEVVVNWSGQLYRCPNVKLDYQLVDLDQASPLDMRAPGAAHGMHALEVAMDELSYAAGIDPLALRLKNYAERDLAKDLPYSSKELHACYQQGAERFGWADRNPAPRSMKEGDELIGWGMATGTWDAMQMLAGARAVLYADGRLVVESATSDIGTGTYTVMTMIAAEAMGLPLEQVTFRLGDSRLPMAPIEGGSATVTTVGAAVEGACEKLQRRLWRMARVMKGSRFRRHVFEDAEFADGQLRIRKQPDITISLAEVMASEQRTELDVGHFMLPNVLRQRKYLRATHSAVFCEVRVDEAFGTVRVTRVVSAVAAGRILSAQTARSQIVGGVVWGISQALHEETLSDPALGRFMNHSFAEYHIATNADVHDIDVIFVAEDDRVVSRMGAKGVGEIGIVGVAAAISNAIFHATGRRVRSLPMTPEKVMAPDDAWAAGDAAVMGEGAPAPHIARVSR
jgi:xanthine dehydrogenase YagR molybdenum-binding subunit